MADDFRSEFRKACYEMSRDLLGASPGDGWGKAAVGAGLLLAGAIGGGWLSHLVLGDHWLVYWVAPVAGAWLLHSAFRYVTGHRHQV